MFFSFDSYVLMSRPFRGIREIITLVFSSDAARNVPTPPSPFITQNVLIVIFIVSQSAHTNVKNSLEKK